jgi:hypothetical protein
MRYFNASFQAFRQNIRRIPDFSGRKSQVAPDVGGFFYLASVIALSLILVSGAFLAVALRICLILAVYFHSCHKKSPVDVPDNTSTPYTSTHGLFQAINRRRT